VALACREFIRTWKYISVISVATKLADTPVAQPTTIRIRQGSGGAGLSDTTRSRPLIVIRCRPSTYSNRAIHLHSARTEAAFLHVFFARLLLLSAAADAASQASDTFAGSRAARRFVQAAAFAILFAVAVLRTLRA